MRSPVHLCQRKFLNRHLRFSIHVSHASFIPTLVAKRYAACFFHTRTFPVVLGMSPVHAIRVFVHPIYAWKQIHAWMQICSEWNEDTLDGSRCLALMYDQTLGWSYVITPGIQRIVKQCWHQALSLECRDVQARILIPCCICSWHAQDLRISTQITLPRPELHDNCSQMKAYCSIRIWGRRKGRHHRRWENQCWLYNHNIFSSYMTAQHVI
jgi:hypothetical protein